MNNVWNPSLENLYDDYVDSLSFLNRLFNHIEEYKNVVNRIIVTNIIIVVLVMLMLALALFLSIFGLDYMGIIRECIQFIRSLFDRAH